MLSLLHQRVTKGSRRRPEVNNNNNNTDVNNFNHEEKRKGSRVEGRRDERMRSEEKGGRRSAEERERGGEAGRSSEEKGGRQSVEEQREERGGRRSVEERKGGSRVARRCSGEERRGKAAETQCSFVEGGGGSGEEESGRGQKPALISASPHCEMPEKGVRRRRKEGEPETRSDNRMTEVRQKKRVEEDEGIQHQSLAPLSPVPDYPSISPRLSRSIQCLATLDNLTAER